MNKILRSLPLLLAGSLLATSCYFEEDDYFEEDAAQRIDSANKAIQEKLVAGSSNGNYGWVIQYFVAGVDEARYEGFNLFASFEQDGKVTMASNHRYLRNGNAGKYTEHVSFYEMLREKGTVLAFNTWNDILTVFADPVDPTKAPGQIVDDGEGMAGDHNFLVMSYSDDEILLRGERHYANSRMIRCDRPWKEYMEAVDAVKKLVAPSAIPYHYVINGTDTMYMVNVNRGYPDYKIKPASNSSTPLSLIFTPNGFRLQEKATIGEDKKEFREFTMSPDSTCLVSEDGETRVHSSWDLYTATHTAVWGLDGTKFSDAQKKAYEEVAAAIKAYNASYELKALCLGKSTGGGAVNGLIAQFYTNAGKTKVNTCGLALTTDLVGFGKVRISKDETPAKDTNLNNMAKKSSGLMGSMNAFAETLVGTYDLKPNNYFLPTGADYSPVGGGTAMSALAL